MNIIQTFHISQHKDPFKDSFGWTSPEYHLMGWALSCLQLKQYYKEVYLYANTSAARLLVDDLQLPYADVFCTHDKLVFPHKELWALSKIYTYRLQDKPFLHIDGDVFLFDSLPESLLNYDLIAQNPEVSTDNYTSIQKELMRYFTFFPPCVKTDFENPVPIQAVNAGILGGQNIAFINEYANLAFEYADKNTQHLQSINADRFNVFLEQHLFYAMVKEKKLSVGFLFSDLVKADEYKYMDDFHDIPFRRTYLHLLGHFKKDEFTCIRMAAKLRELYPDYYYKILSLFGKKETTLSPCYFSKRIGVSVNYHALHGKAQRAYNENIITNNDTNSAIDETTNTHLILLKETATFYSAGNSEMKKDFAVFYYSLITILKKNLSFFYLYGRDLSATSWYRDLFADETNLLGQRIVKSAGIEIIKSQYDWAGIFNKHYRFGVEYYEQLQIQQGNFSNLIIPEISENRFSIYDINELDKLIIEFLSEPLSIRELLTEMQVYFEDEVIQNHYQSFVDVIVTSLKQLVIKKAIQPIIPDKFRIGKQKIYY